MLYPINNTYRQCIDLSGFWAFKTDPDECGEREDWFSGLPDPRPIAVPASWNDQFADLRDFLGPAWYQTHLDLPWGWQGQRIFLRFNSVNYQTMVWLNGTFLGDHEGGHLPFIFEVTDQINAQDNLLVLRVDGRLAPDHVPPGNVIGSDLDFFASHQENFPQTQFDFFPYCGIHRPVLLYTQPRHALDDITVVTNLEGDRGKVHLNVKPFEAPIHAILTGDDDLYQVEGTGTLTFDIPHAKKWSPKSPYLYDLTVSRMDGKAILDAYNIKVGIRTIAIDGVHLLLNGQPVYLKGFGRHEDFPVSGRGYNPSVIIKDYALMGWMGANSFRTSHYPYAEQMMDLADQLGFLIIDETPAVGLYFDEEGFDHRLALCKRYLHALIQRDKNHPSVIAWSLANEPHSIREGAKPFFRELYDLARTLDRTRPITLASCMGTLEEAFEFLDFMCLNRYFGWYQLSGQIEGGVALLSTELDLLYETYRKPILLTEFGADAIPGIHAHPPEMFSEEYQAALIAQYVTALRSKPYVIGEHIWNLCDFKTAQGITRMSGINHKGIFTRDRRPKMAAHRLREIWNQESEG
jgi:beta-glucuronidase